MPACCVPLCKNRSENGYRVFQLPQGKSNEKRRQVWLDFINRTEVPTRAHVCEAHFEATAFESSRQDGKKLLKWNSVPTIPVFEFQSPPGKKSHTEVSREENHHSHCEESKGATSVTALDDENKEWCDNAQYQNLKTKLKNTQKMVQVLQVRVKQMEDRLKELFNPDQIEFLTKGSHRGVEWSDETINKGLKLYMACGAKGYEEVRKQNLPYPSVRTLQHRIRNFKFEAGVLNEVFDLLQIKTSTLCPEEKHAALLMDEMALQPRLQYDNSVNKVIGRPTMLLSGKADSSNEVATHALVFMVAGLTSRWKQTVAYEFTGNSYDAEQTLEKINAIIHKATASGLTVETVISDMGPQNRAVWRILHITAHRHGRIVNWYKHPVNAEKRLYVMPDPIHIFKNIANALIKHKIFYLDENIVRKYNLPSNSINLEAIEEVCCIEEKEELKMAPRLKKSIFDPTHFDKMNVNFAFAMFNNDTAAAITYYISVGKLRANCHTTAWFCKTLYHWFSLMSARHPKLGLACKKNEAYEEATIFFQDFMAVIRGMQINNGIWQPFQCGVLLATQTALDLQAKYLQNEHFKYFLLGRLTQDAIENLFSVVRSRKAVPGPQEFKTALRLILLSQYETQTRGNYLPDNAEALVKYCKEMKSNDATSNNTDTDINLPLGMDIADDDTREINDASGQCLYYLLGNILHKVKTKACDTCYQPLIHNLEDNNNICDNSIVLLTKLKDYEENLLTYPVFSLYEFIKKAELYFRTVKHQMLHNQITAVDVARMFLHSTHYSHLDCHNIINKIVTLFMRTRFFFAVRDANNEIHANCIEQRRSSRSIAMRSVLKTIK